jgi:hypothetical protein
MVDLSSRNTNPLGVFDGEAIPLSDVADTRIEDSCRGAPPTTEHLVPFWFKVV